MAEIKWTKEQERVINTRNCNLLVAAAAGSGKTAVLVQRIINMIMDEKNPIDIDKLLVVTFTNAAASEMRERIGDALSKEIGKGKNSLRLQRQLTLLNKASITTIHSFCLNVIKNNFHKVDVDPGFRVADETEVILLKSEVMEDLFNHKYENINNKDLEEHCIGEEFLSLVETYCNNKEDTALMNLVLRLHSFSNTTPNPKQWLMDKSEEFNLENFVDIEHMSWIKVLKNVISIELEEYYKQYEECYDIVTSAEELSPYEKVISEELAMISDLSLNLKNSFTSFAEELKVVKFQRLPSIRNIEDKEGKESVQNIRNNVKKSLEDIRKNYAGITADEIKESYGKVYPIIKNLTYLVMQFDQQYRMRKKEKGIIDFNDFEHFCLEILIEKDEKGQWLKDKEGNYIPSSSALELREKYEEILIDEYQDSNLVQELILNLVSKIKEGNPNIFMVGDIKQSIYRFRQAKPELFLTKYNSYSEIKDEEEEKDTLFKKILLFKNFRSRKEILDGVNFIFESIMSERVGELQYDHREALNLGANYEEEIEGATLGGNIELHILDKEAHDEGEEEIGDIEEDKDIPTDISYEAKITAKRIKELLESEEKPFMVLDKQTKEYRRVMYKDIVILLRSTVNWAEQFMEEFKKYNIPVYADTNTGYFETTEVKTMLSLLQVIDNPIQDIPLLSVMRSPIGGFNSEDFIDIRIANESLSFYEASLRYIDKEEGELKERLEEFLNKLELWREKSLYTPIDEFIWYLYMETGYYGFVGALKNGAQRQANLKILFQRAREYGKTSYNGLFNFINFINRLKKNSGDMGSAKTLGENENVVRIMSIHKSKGLEFPVVFLCGMGKQFNLQDLNDNLLLHHGLGFGPDLIDFERRISYPLPVKKAIREKIRIETLSEEMRILYVALTRAKEKLILIGATKKVSDFIKKACENCGNKGITVPEFYVAKGKSYLDWVILALVKHGEAINNLKEEFYRYTGEDLTINNLIEDNSKWSIKIWNKSEVEEVEEEEEEQDRSKCLRELLSSYIESSKESDGYYEFVDKRLSYEYPYMNASTLPTVVTVSELKRRFNLMEEENTHSLISTSLKKKPKFMEGKTRLTGADRGTAFHAIMEYLDLNKVGSVEEIKNQVFEMYAKEFITEEQSKVVDCNKIFSFFNTDLGLRMLKAYPKVYREQEFHIPLKSTELLAASGEVYGDEGTLLQGIIDCYFDEDGEIILLDYKTDFLLEGEEEGIINKYKSQLDYYGRAVERITGKKVKEKYLYLFTLDKYVMVK
ncbi:helicase-exonuclease AddAB subunit AddA [Hathewaya massiliensis]|uniref:helicase-exonuclease AddAB subunit AddA n=1 Tax=Hathewaya massiliensis TaxID=1964382 RepID=UPI001159725C|nr:helicase-exonuclease AddAB subunit AddA [Hathewaya massiliensis]